MEVGSLPTILRCRFDLSIRDLSFTYPGTNTPALLGINLDLPAGKKLAIVGPSGAGKSTLADLLLRFWDAPRRTVWINERDLYELPEDSFRDCLSVIPQRAYLFNATIRDNILLASPKASNQEIEQACRQAGILEFIHGLPGGFETMVGERGVRLSAGECQRLAVARAFLKNSSFFLLDEPTSNLDPIVERSILENILVRTANKSILLITHRLAGMDRMDEILVLDNGQIIERGTHDELSRQGGLYHRLLDLQHHFSVTKR